MPSSGNSGMRGSNEMEFMKNVAYLIKESGMGYKEVMELPYQIFLSLLKQFRVLDLESTEEGREYLEQCRVLRTKEADLTAFRNLKEKLGG